MSSAPTSETFAIGDGVVVLKVTMPQWSHYVGTCGEVVSFRDSMPVIRLDLDGREEAAAPGYVRKIQPPREDYKLVKWDECPWQPEKINAA